jgi:hypothetical protein
MFRRSSYRVIVVPKPRKAMGPVRTIRQQGEPS